MEAGLQHHNLPTDIALNFNDEPESIDRWLLHLKSNGGDFPGPVKWSSRKKRTERYSNQTDFFAAESQRK